VKTPIPSISQRLLLVGVTQLLAFEVLEQATVHCRESMQELCQMALLFGTISGFSWAVLPALRGVRRRAVRIGCRAALVVLAFATTFAGDYFYAWHLRPNLGLYREPDWVADHPAFQRELRVTISNNTWKIRGAMGSDLYH
jgi:hypothetical protein